MKKSILYGVWLVLYAICAGLSFVENPVGLQKSALTVMSIFFFAPGAMLLINACKAKDRKTVLLLRWVSGASVALTVVVLIANLFSALGSEALGNALYTLLILVSVPMVCSQSWALSIFLWLCLFFATFLLKKKALKS